jgi:trans-aconitate methyltransferase
MEYCPATDGRHVGARLAGCYELELHETVERCCNTPYGRIIDVGCAEGYYAVGFARRIPSAQVFAFDTDPWARRTCRAMAAANGVSDRVHLGGYCPRNRLQSFIAAGRTLILSDCEGYEAILLDPRAIPELARCDMIVELHDAAPTPDHPLMAKFRASHEIELVRGSPRTGAEVEMLRDLTPSEQLQLVDELRQPWQGWAVFWAK